MEGDDFIKFVFVNGLGNEEYEIVKKLDFLDYFKDYCGFFGLLLFVNFFLSFFSNFLCCKLKGFCVVFIFNFSKWKYNNYEIKEDVIYLFWFKVCMCSVGKKK